MRWRVEKIEDKENPIPLVGRKGPKPGDLKVVKKFAFAPIYLNDEDVVWLERYVEIYEWKKIKVKKFKTMLK